MKANKDMLINRFSKLYDETKAVREQAERDVNDYSAAFDALNDDNDSTRFILSKTVINDKLEEVEADRMIYSFLVVMFAEAIAKLNQDCETKVTYSSLVNMIKQ